MKAIHNGHSAIDAWMEMFMPIIRYKNESNSQHRRVTIVRLERCLCQSLDTRMKAIHNQQQGEGAVVGDVYANH